MKIVGRGWNRGIASECRGTSCGCPGVGAALIALLLGGVIGLLTPALWVAIIGVLVMTLMLVLRQDELAATVVIAVHLYADWYLGLRFVALFMTVALLLIFYLARSPRRPWVEPRASWLWILFLILTIYPAIHGALTLYDIDLYYPNIIFGAFVIFWLGIVVARNTGSVRLLFQILALFGALLAIHAIIQATTGKFLFASSQLASSYDSGSYYLLARGSNIHRLGSFLIGPDWNGTFFALMLFIPLGLFVESLSFLSKIFYVTETILMLIALLLTYSAGAFLATFVGVIAFTILVGNVRYRLQIPLLIIGAAAVLFIWFPTQVNALFLHASGGSQEVTLRLGAVQTALRVIQAFPLTGVGLGTTAYAQRAEPYRVPAQYDQLAQPHDSYLEWGAMAGLPVLAIFVALLLFALWLALRNWKNADGRARSLLGGGIAAVVTLSVNSATINGWTLPPLAALGWLILGIVSSPLLATVSLPVSFDIHKSVPTGLSN